MPSSMTLPIMAGLSILGAATGVTLGRSAISEIDPAYFTDPEVPFHADLVPYRSPDWAQVQAAEYQETASTDGLGAGCVRCRDYPVEYVPQHDPSVDYYAAPAPQSAAAEAEPALIYDAPAADPEIERVQLYAGYPLSEQAEPAAADGEEEAQAYSDTE